MLFQSNQEEAYFNNDINKKLRDKTIQLVELECSYQSALETIGRMAVHTNNLEKEKNMFAERYEMLIESNRWNMQFGIRTGGIQRESNNFQDPLENDNVVFDKELLEKTEQKEQKKKGKGKKINRLYIWKTKI